MAAGHSERLELESFVELDADCETVLRCQVLKKIPLVEVRPFRNKVLEKALLQSQVQATVKNSHVATSYKL